MPRLHRAAWDVIAVLSPLLSGFAFYWWLNWSPKVWFDPQCGLPNWVVATFAPFLAIPPLFAGIRLRQSGKGWSTAISLALVVLGVTIVACLIAFYSWFVKHNCGE